MSILYRFDRSVRVTRGLRTRRPAPQFSRGRASHAHVEVRPQPATHGSANRPLAVLVGVGPGFGFGLARHLAGEGFDLVLACRNAESLSALVRQLHELGASAEAYGVDATDELRIDRLFDHVACEYGCPALVVYSVQYFSPGLATQVEVPAFEASWRHNCLGAFLVARKAAQAMEASGRGTIVFIGSTSSVIGRADHLNLAVGKFGQRALAQVMARELWTRGVHVAHVLIDADIAEDGANAAHPQAQPEDIARAVLYLHRQPRSAWTSEMDLRPWNERFWEHC